MIYAKYFTLHFSLMKKQFICRLAVFHFRQRKGGTTGGAGGALSHHLSTEWDIYSSATF